MAKSEQYIRAQLVNFTNAQCSDSEIKNRRYHYYLKFEKRIGWEWLWEQVQKCSKKCDLELEPYEIGPSGMHSFELEVRECERRLHLREEEQHSFEDFEQ